MIDVILALAAVAVSAVILVSLLRRPAPLPEVTGHRHDHVWADPAYDYTPPRPLAQAERASMLDHGMGQSVERADLGFTTVSKRCTICGDVSSELQLGRVSAR